MRTLTDYAEYADRASSLANPFPGLRPFDVWENHLFFGREGQIDTLLWKLGRNHFVSIVGTSGSGKSSLVRAGLLPVLLGGFNGQAGTAWRIAIMRPGSDPLRNLALALNAEDVYGTGDADEDGRRVARAEATLQSSSLGLVQLVREARMRDDENILIVVDQFEELFRFKENERIEGAADEASAFVRLLLECVTQREAPIYVALTLRSDFLGDCAQFRDLPETINEGQYLIPRLRREQIRSAITGPVAVGGGKIAPRLTQRLLNDVGDNPDQLPILQHALMRTWDRWVEDHQEGEPIDLRHYQAIGGMRKALSQHADEAYNELPTDNGRRICEVMFKALTERGPDNRGIRRPTHVGDICAIAGASVPEVIEVVDVFRRPGRTFIMPPHNINLSADSVIDISHESLMRVWERLERWVDDDADSAQMYRRIVESALLYEGGQAGLWRDPDLQIAEEWREREKPTESWAARYHAAFPGAMRFLDSSIDLRNEEIRDRRRRRRVAQAISVAFLLCAAVLTVWALNERASAERNYETALAQGTIAKRQKTEAERQKVEAERQRNLAEGQKKEADASRRTAVEQRKRADEQRAVAQQQQKIAVQQKQEALAQRQLAEEARKDALLARDTAESQRRAAVEQRQLAVSLADSISRSRLLSIAQGLAKTVQLGKVDQGEVNALLALQAFNFNRSNGGYDRDPDVYGALFSAAKSFTPESDRVLRGHRDGVRSVVYSRDGSRLISAGSDGLILMWDARTPGVGARELARNPFTVRSIAMDRTGKRLAYAGHDRAIRIIDDLSDPQSRIVVPDVDHAIHQIAWLDDGHIAALGASGSIKIVNTASGRVESVLATREATRVRSMAVAPQQGLIGAGTATGEVVIWKAASPDLEQSRVQMSTRPVTVVAFSPDGRQGACGAEDGTIRTWSAAEHPRPQGLLAGHRSSVNALTFSSDGRILASGSNDATVRLWDLARPTSEPMLVHEHTSWVWAVAFGPDDATIVSAGFDKSIRFQPARADLLVNPLQSSVNRNLSRREWGQYIGGDITYQRTVQKFGDGE